ncbi:MAG: hypothetical protein M0Z77_06890 [Thermoplasmatales archaeon]|jgi:hypothetical protein|nr:hypothetical protein [Candidatus Thermoplasmatota archaeon]MDA8055359.1 hypothetical protein [Thermoplasmatales archaeon]
MNFLSNLDKLGEVRRDAGPIGPRGNSGTDIQNELAKLSTVSAPHTDYNSIFSLVRKAVKTFTGKERVGLGLALADLPSQLGAFWEVGGNYIVMNRNLLEALKYANRSKVDVNSYVFVILTHEYLHSLGVLDENMARTITAQICATTFEEGHPAFELGTRDPWQVYPFLAYAPSGKGENLRIISNFDSDSVSYIM